MEYQVSTCVRLAIVSRLFAIILATLFLALPVSASAYLYWDVSEGVTRANLNGSEMTTGFIQKGSGGSIGLAISDGYIYFSGYGGVIGRARLNGSDIDPDLVTLPQPVPENPSDQTERTERNASSLAVAGAYIYWASDIGGIGRAKAGGGGVEPYFIKLEAPAEGGGPAVDAGHIYWASEHAVGRANLDGSDVEPDFLPLVGTHLNGIAVGDGHIYWTARETHDIGRADLDGRHVNPRFITALGFAAGPAVGGGYIYWHAEETLTRGRRLWIARANLNGGDVRNTLINITRYGTGQLAADALGPGGDNRSTHRNRVVRRRAG
jgi:hypothetical protein